VAEREPRGVTGDLDVAGLRNRVAPSVERILHDAARLGFFGGMPVDEQIDHALGFVFVVESVLGRSPRSVLDMGTGGGMPGLVLASCWPSSRTVMLDSNERRTAFLAAAIAGLGAGVDIEVIRGRAEECAREEALRTRFELVSARSFGPPAVTAECGAPFLSVAGLVVASEPPDDEDGSRWPVEGLAQLGLSPGDALRFDDRFGYQVLVKTGPTPDRFPRRVGIPTKRPLF
jgi:16S rRNA (guanine527-N7)-methyltransferase